MKMNVAIIRCKSEAKVCFGERCFAALKHKEGQFSSYTDFNLVSFIDCGGCDNILEFENTINDLILFTRVDIIHLANCIVSHSDIPYKGLTQNEIYSILKKKGKKRFNDDTYVLKRAKLLFNKELPYECLFKEKFVSIITNKGVKVVEGTHGRISLPELMLNENNRNEI